ncbi:hypothetical protein OG455_08015 [Kitasatospora sp. NBC_01287]|uniref:hypothetical protein n=1 Tax=Kitasatospora sp. NBC_01287 TaxID=2903573 RepID=UPI00225AE637|nr:hypothetical protein [Kitasatospora sp. NBC_01287]MCX4745467.1 hypothetical protein [Kitasatospora sp. NBC_01287]
MTIGLPGEPLSLHGSAAHLTASGPPSPHNGRPDTAHLHWPEHPAPRAAELRPAPDLNSVVGTLRG